MSFMSDPTSLFISNLPREKIDQSELLTVFSKFGYVESVKVADEHGTRICRGYGFVTMSRKSDALYIMERRNGDIYYHDHRLRLKLALSPSTANAVDPKTICYQWKHENRCFKGDSCTFKHVSYALCESMKATGRCPEGVTCKFVHDRSKFDFCMTFKRSGSCAHGDTCKYAHEAPLPTPAATNTATCTHGSITVATVTQLIAEQCGADATAESAATTAVVNLVSEDDDDINTGNDKLQRRPQDEQQYQQQPSVKHTSSAMTAQSTLQRLAEKAVSPVPSFTLHVEPTSERRDIASNSDSERAAVIIQQSLTDTQTKAVPRGSSIVPTPTSASSTTTRCKRSGRDADEDSVQSVYSCSSTERYCWRRRIRHRTKEYYQERGRSGGNVCVHG